MRSQKKKGEEEETDFVRKACVHERQNSTFTGGRNPHFSNIEVVSFRSPDFNPFHLEPGPVVTTSGVQGSHNGLAVPPEKWEFLLLLCLSAVIIFIAPAAQSDPRSRTH